MGDREPEAERPTQAPGSGRTVADLLRERYGPGLFRYFLHHLGDPAAAERLTAALLKLPQRPRSFLVHIPAEPPPSGHSPARWILQAAPWVLASVLILLLGTIGLGLAARDSLPSEALYPAKRLTEQVRLALAPYSEIRCQVLLSTAEARLTEVARECGRGDCPDWLYTDLVAQTQASLEAAVDLPPGQQAAALSALVALARQEGEVLAALQARSESTGQPLEQALHMARYSGERASLILAAGPGLPADTAIGEPTATLEPPVAGRATTTPTPAALATATPGSEGTPLPPATPGPTDSPPPPDSPKPTEPTRTPKPTHTPKPTEPTRTPKPTHTPRPTEPTRTPKPTHTPKPTSTPKPTREP